MKRRSFIKLSATTALMLLFGAYNRPLEAGNPPPTTTDKTIISVALDGGPDFRYLIVPAYLSDNNDATSYAATFWRARASLFKKKPTDDLKTVYETYYDTITIDGIKCGILKSCEWLKEQILVGNVAIINNVIASSDRNHYHSKMVIESGDHTAPTHSIQMAGWGGKAAKQQDYNVISFTNEMRLICNAPHPTNPLDHENSCVISMQKSREMGLSSYNTQADLDSSSNNYKTSPKAIMSRALSSYYAAKEPHIPPSSIYRKPIEHERSLRVFGNLLKERFTAIPTPSSLENLITSSTQKLNSTYFATQLKSLYDGYAAQDILRMGFASIEYTGWDSHKLLRENIDPKLTDMFGVDRGFDRLTRELMTLRGDAFEKSAFVIFGEFGRQLKSNGDNGTDHGRGNSIIIISPSLSATSIDSTSVTGCFYGDPFPADELSRLETINTDIVGKTSTNRVFAELLNWQQDGLGNLVFDSLDTSLLESGVDLSGLFTI